jgi:hypothetical protein
MASVYNFSEKFKTSDFFTSTYSTTYMCKLIIGRRSAKEFR